MTGGQAHLAAGTFRAAAANELKGSRRRDLNFCATHPGRAAAPQMRAAARQAQVTASVPDACSKAQVASVPGKAIAGAHVQSASGSTSARFHRKSSASGVR